MNAKDFLRLGVPLGEATRRATDFVSRFILGGGDKSRLHEEVAAIVANPSALLADELRKDFAKALLAAPPPPRAEPVKYHQWGEGLEHEAVMQMEKACLFAGVGGGRVDAGCARGLRSAHRRRAGHGERGDPLRRGRGHRVPHEVDGAGPSGARSGRQTGPAHARESRPKRASAWVRRSAT